MLNFVENLLENERGPMNDQDLTKTDYDPDRSLVLIEGLSHFLTNFLQNLASCQTSLSLNKMRRKFSRNFVPSSCIRHDNSTKENLIHHRFRPIVSLDFLDYSDNSIIRQVDFSDGTFNS
jgi:hypothetical protein